MMRSPHEASPVFIFFLCCLIDKMDAKICITHGFSVERKKERTRYIRGTSLSFELRREREKKTEKD